MRYALKSYQEEAVRGVLANLNDAKDDFKLRSRRSAFALSATTGAGKTVIASAVIEALFSGSDDFNFAPDRSAVVLWVTDDPSLNEQTRHRMISAADRLEIGQLVTIGNGTGKANFDQEKLRPGHVYFLNIQKFRSGSTWIRRGDGRSYTLWDTIRNTVNDAGLTLYLVLDEAHKGMRRATRTESGETRSTIVQRIINGHDDVPPVPVVWGISATIDRFNSAMVEANAQGRMTYPAVNIDAAHVQESGLLKDTIVLSFPDEKGDFETTLLRLAVEQILETSKLWSDYSGEAKQQEFVEPLLVVQVPNRPSDAQLKRYLDVVFGRWPGLRGDAIAHVFGDHGELKLPGYLIPYVQPQDVQESSHIRVLLAKDAVSTGWDCPRAEVLFSLRPASDRTHITQLLGRMVRTPLARRVSYDERLNSVSCVLAHFDRRTAVQVANRLTGKAAADDLENESVVSQRRVITDPVELHWNPDVDVSVQEYVQSLPSEPRPNPEAKPMKRLLMLAAALARDELSASPDETARESIYNLLDGLVTQHQDEVDATVEEIFQADLLRVTANMVTGTTDEEKLRIHADFRTVDDAYRYASRLLGSSVANGYVKHRAFQANGDDADYVEARAEVASVVRVDGVVAAVDEHAEKLVRRWLSQYRVAILALPDDRQAAYSVVRAQARLPERDDVKLPVALWEQDKDDAGDEYPKRKLHFFSDSSGDYPLAWEPTSWETQVIDTELNRSNVVAWYRNPSQAVARAFTIPYRSGSKWKSMQPDFIFVARSKNGELTASIVDPHSPHLADALLKLRGLANFAEKYQHTFQRIDSLAKAKDGRVMLLDLRDDNVRKAVESADSAEALYESSLAVQYS